ncbi:MAG: tetratricopeptide repeat-containing sensor histidine kinase [Niabella sp.]
MKLFILLCFLLISFNSAAQHIDSLKQAIANCATDTCKVKAYHNVANPIKHNNPHEAMRYINEGLALANRIGYKKGQAFLLSLAGTIYNTGGEAEKALDVYQQSYLKYKELKDKAGMGNVLNNIAGCYLDRGDYTTAADYYTQCLTISEEVNDEYLTALAYANLGIVFGHQGDFKKSLAYHKKALSHYRKYDEEPYEQNRKIASTFKNIAAAYFGMDSLKQAEDYYKKSLQLYEALNDLTGQASLYAKIGELYKKDPPKMLYYGLKSQNIWDTVNPRNMLSVNNLGNIGAAYLEMAKSAADYKTKGQKASYLRNAESYLSRALEYSKQNKDIDAEWLILSFMAELEEFQGNYKAAVQYMKSSSAIRDSIYSQENKNTIAAIESRREIEAREKQIEINQLALSNAKRTRIALIASSILLMIIGGLLFYQNQTRRKTNTTLLMLNNELDEANKVKTKFFGILSHDLRSPVANLLHFLHLQQEEPYLMDKEKSEKHRQQLTQSAENLLETMEAMLLWSKSQMEYFAPHQKLIDVDHLFNYIQKQIPQNTPIRISFSNPEKLMVSTDEDYLKTIMYNLTANAVKALANTINPRIDWKAQKVNGSIALSISDNGPGVHKEQVDALYNEQAVVGTRHGLGLHLIRDLAKAIQCTIQLKNNTASGVSFTLYLSG